MTKLLSKNAKLVSRDGRLVVANADCKALCCQEHGPPRCPGTAPATEAEVWKEGVLLAVMTEYDCGQVPFPDPEPQFCGGPFNDAYSGCAGTVWHVEADDHHFYFYQDSIDDDNWHFTEVDTVNCDDTPIDCGNTEVFTDLGGNCFEYNNGTYAVRWCAS